MTSSKETPKKREADGASLSMSAHQPGDALSDPKGCDKCADIRRIFEDFDRIEHEVTRLDERFKVYDRTALLVASAGQRYRGACDTDCMLCRILYASLSNAEKAESARDTPPSSPSSDVDDLVLKRFAPAFGLVRGNYNLKTGPLILLMKPRTEAISSSNAITTAMQKNGVAVLVKNEYSKN